jgi:hypothetical protein
MEASIRRPEPVLLIFASGWLQQLRKVGCPGAKWQDSLAWASGR